jgi:hypothetical protein
MNKVVYRKENKLRRDFDKFQRETHNLFVEKISKLPGYVPLPEFPPKNYTIVP